VLSPAGRVVDTVELGTMEPGRHSFNWKASGLPDDAHYTFRITATKGTTAVSSTPLMRDRVDAVNTNGTSLVLETRNNGPIAYSDIKAFN